MAGGTNDLNAKINICDANGSYRWKDRGKDKGKDCALVAWPRARVDGELAMRRFPK